ncbi:class I SAM-dependent methyltransferase [Methylorubrum populi]|uniref:class I SAM-dependent methyltransferase n=1 Tax=Methylorubrum populi TaxID=223967 RepID=UPI00114F0EEB|nr:methyltransferase domain-containing protein [Methylorubrum populi]QDI82174.1 class I SAM-dependent methyltransferase [Methylorubrum populi]
MTRALDDYLSTLVDMGSEVLTNSLRLWKNGVQSEQAFWTRWFETQGLEWPADFKERQIDRDVPSWLSTLFPPGRGEVSILDVGSGPLPKIGNKHPNRPVRVLAADPLAHFYNELVSQHLPQGTPIPVIFSFAEDLSCRFEPESFDLINCTNALDHSVAPMWALLEMTLILKKNGKIILSHRRNEATVENYEGFHQWNFDISNENDNLIFWNESNTINVNSILGDYCSIKHLTPKDSEYITSIIVKESYPNFDSLRYHRILRACLLEAMLEIA